MVTVEAGPSRSEPSGYDLVGSSVIPRSHLRLRAPFQPVLAGPAGSVYQDRVADPAVASTGPGLQRNSFDSSAREDVRPPAPDAAVTADPLVTPGLDPLVTPGGPTRVRGRASWVRSYAHRILVTDVMVVVLAGLSAHVFRIGSTSSQVSRSPFDPSFIALTSILVVLWLLTLVAGRSREGTVVGHGAEEYRRVVQGSIGVFGAAAICSYVFDLDMPRAYVLIMLPIGLAGLLTTRFAWRRWLHVQRRSDRYVSRVLAVGNIRTVADLIADLHRSPMSSYRIRGACVTPEDGRLPDQVAGVPVLGNLDSVAVIAAEHEMDVVAVTATAAFGPHRVRRLGWALEKTDTELVLAPALTNIAGPRVHTTPLAGLPLIHVDRPTYRGANQLLKRLFDLAVGGLLVIAFSPIFLISAAAIKLGDRGPVFFRQDRVGLGGATFRMTKFRSMVPDAETRLSDLIDQQRDVGNDVLFKMQDDPRVTRVGRLLRRLSVDELPQLFNVLRGQMSLVGPRPPLRDEVAVYQDDAMLRLLVKPGLTGLWQVSGRSDLSWEDSVRLDTYYVENWSLTGDLVILFKTVKAVLRSTGAY